jgi:tetratricopeptide (TPR) repeat protein
MRCAVIEHVAGLSRRRARPFRLSAGRRLSLAGQWQAALGHLAEARRLAEETGNRRYQAETLRLRGDVLLAMGDSISAEASYGESLALARQRTSCSRRSVAGLPRASARRFCKRRRRCWTSCRK